MQYTKLKVIDDFVDLSTMAHHFRGEVWSYGWKSNVGAEETPFWHIHFCGSRQPDEFVRQDELLAENRRLSAISAVWERIKDEVAPDYHLVRCYANGHTYGLDGHVHRDAKPGEDALTALVYINSTWRPEWAGETVFIGEDGRCEAVMPRPGRMIVFDGTVQHVARSPSRDCPALRMTLVFKLKRNDPSDSINVAPLPRASLLGFLRRRGAADSAHSGRALLDHLVGTWRLLKEWGCEEQVCLAGLFHSVYGTSIYRHRSVSAHERGAVRALIGARAEELAFVFGVIARPNAWSGALTHGKATLHGVDDALLTLEPRMLDDLLELEIANLVEQGDGEAIFDTLIAGGVLEREGVHSSAREALATAGVALTSME